MALEEVVSLCKEQLFQCFQSCQLSVAKNWIGFLKYYMVLKALTQHHKGNAVEVIVQN